MTEAPIQAARRIVREVYVCEKCGQRWNCRNDAREHEEKCDAPKYPGGRREQDEARSH